MTNISSKGHIVIVGAGVTGIQTGVLLFEAGYRISFVAEHYPGDLSIEYASPWAGGDWRGGLDGPTFELYENATFKHWTNLLKSGQTNIGLQFIPSFDYWEEKPKEDQTTPSWTSLVPDFRVIPASELPPNTEYGQNYKTIAVNPNLYLPYLLSLLPPETTKIRHHITSLSEVTKLPELQDAIGVINCTGLGSKFLEDVKDEKLFPTRGQTVLIQPMSEVDITWQGKNGVDVWYIIPRAGGGGSVLGGCKLKGDWDPNPDPVLTERILKHTAALAPKSLLTKSNNTEFNVVSVQVGRRPSRTGGVRIEMVKDGLGDAMFLAHHYGHGGSGYQTSYGSATMVLGLVEEVLRL